MKYLIKLTSVESYLKDSSSNASMDKYLSKGSAFSFKGIPGIDNTFLANLLGKFVHYFDIACILGVFIALIWLIRSTLGNSGENTAKGVRTPLYIYFSALTIHFFILCLFSYSSLSGTAILSFSIFLISEIIMMFGATLLFGLGTFYAEGYIMTKQPSYQRRSKTAYNFMLLSLGIVGVLSILVLII